MAPGLFIYEVPFYLAPYFFKHLLNNAGKGYPEIFSGPIASNSVSPTDSGEVVKILKQCLIVVLQGFRKGTISTWEYCWGLNLGLLNAKPMFYQ